MSSYVPLPLAPSAASATELPASPLRTSLDLSSRGTTPVSMTKTDAQLAAARARTRLLLASAAKKRLNLSQSLYLQEEKFPQETDYDSSARSSTTSLSEPESTSKRPQRVPFYQLPFDALSNISSVPAPLHALTDSPAPVPSMYLKPQAISAHFATSPSDTAFADKLPGQSLLLTPSQHPVSNSRSGSRRIQFLLSIQLSAL